MKLSEQVSLFCILLIILFDCFGCSSYKPDDPLEFSENVAYPCQFISCGSRDEKEENYNCCFVSNIGCMWIKESCDNLLVGDK